MSEHSIPAGTYIAKCTGAADAKFGYSDGGGEQIGLSLALMNEGFEGRLVSWYGSFVSEDSRKITFRTLRDFGWVGDDLTVLDGIDVNEVEIVIAYESWNGKERLKIKRVAPVGGIKVEMKKEMDDAARRAFALKMKGAAMQSKPRTPAAATGGRGAPAFGPPATTPGGWDGTGPDPAGF